MAFSQPFRIGKVSILFRDVMPDGTLTDGSCRDRDNFRRLLAAGRKFTLDSGLNQSHNDSVITIEFDNEPLYTCRSIDIEP